MLVLVCAGSLSGAGVLALAGAGVLGVLILEALGSGVGVRSSTCAAPVVSADVFGVGLGALTIDLFEAVSCRRGDGRSLVSQSDHISSVSSDRGC